MKVPAPALRRALQTQIDALQKKASAALDLKVILAPPCAFH
jgi:hypothetical protein